MRERVVLVLAPGQVKPRRRTKVSTTQKNSTSRLTEGKRTSIAATQLFLLVALAASKPLWIHDQRQLILGEQDG